MKTTRILAILILTIACGIAFINCLTLDLTIIDAIILSIIAVVTWLSCIIMECIELVKVMKKVKVMKPVQLICPKCKSKFEFKSYWTWVWKAQFHLLGWDKETKCIYDYRLTKCPFCGYKSWIKREK